MPIYTHVSHFSCSAFIVTPRQGKTRYLIIEKFSMFVYWININKSLTKIPDVKENAKEHRTCSHEIRLPWYCTYILYVLWVPPYQVYGLLICSDISWQSNIHICFVNISPVMMTFSLTTWCTFTPYRCLHINNSCRLIGRICLEDIGVNLIKSRMWSHS